MNSTPSTHFAIGSLAPAIVSRAAGPIEDDGSLVDERIVGRTPSSLNHAEAAAVPEESDRSSSSSQKSSPVCA